ncbi:MAG TPA: hypothetical protein VKH81_11360 [Candidatus Angelobacter sp.]|nr:hypothetical protein [Candidatus Angelobacter sp.]
MADSVSRAMLRTALWLLAAVASWIGLFWWNKHGYSFLGSLLWAVAGGWSVGKTGLAVSRMRKSKSKIREST